jgi:hypothetical protein
MTALESLTIRLKEFKVKYEYDFIFSFEENRGAFLNRLVSQMVGNYVEEVMCEWDPDPESKFLGAGLKTDWENSTCVVEQKKTPQTNNGSSKKADIDKLKKDAERKSKTPIFAYWQDRRKNDYVKDGVRYLHGIAIFKYLGIKNYEEQYKLFLDDVYTITIMIKEDLTNKFNEKFQSYNIPTV